MFRKRCGHIVYCQLLKLFKLVFIDIYKEREISFVFIYCSMSLGGGFNQAVNEAVNAAIDDVRIM